MLFKTHGIVLNYIKYRETSIITKIYTESFGSKSYIVNGVRAKKPRTGSALFQPLTLLDLVVYNKDGRDINYISEVKCAYPYNSVPFDQKKASIAVFLAEIVTKTLREEESNPELFNFLFQSFLTLDKLNQGTENFHLIFLLKLKKYLGVDPVTWQELISQVGNVIHDETTHRLGEQLMTAGFDDELRIPSNHRRDITDLIIRFYRQHAGGFFEPKSLAILREVFKE